MVGGGSFCGDMEVFALMMVIKEVMLTSLPELAHWGGGTMGHNLALPYLKNKLTFQQASQG